MFFEIIGIMEEHEFLLNKFGEVFVESIMKDHSQLGPVVKEGLTHTTDPTSHEGKATRDFEVRFRIFDGSYEITADFDYAYDLDEIGETAIPYVKALRDIHAKLYELK